MMAAALTLAGMSLGELLGAAAGAHAEIEIEDLVLDSRQVVPGAAFVAVPGATTHGLEHAVAALAQGAAVVLYEPSEHIVDVPEPSIPIPDLRARLGELAQTFFGRNGGAETLAAVTGTNGKTTVAYLTAQAMHAAGSPCGYIGTLGFGQPGALATHALTTPDCLTLHRELRQMQAAHAVLEASSHAIEQKRIAGLDIGVAAFTNLSRDHLDRHGDMQRYGNVKAQLFAVRSLKTAVVNVDDAFGAALAARLPRGVTPLRTSLRAGASAELVGVAALLGLAGLEIAVDGSYGKALLRSPLIGDFNAENLMVSLGTLLAWRVPLAAAVEALGAAKAAPGRLDVLGGANAPHVVVDYAHTPAALERALAVLRALGTGELWCVFGCGGDRDRGKRAEMGTAAARGADHIVLTDDNPRNEDPAAIVADIRAGLPDGVEARVEHDRRRAIGLAVERARPGDVVLVAGKGHETHQLVAGRYTVFDDRDAARAALEERA